MERAMLDDDRATVDADNLAVGEGVSDYSCCLGVEVVLGVGGIEHRSVDDEEIGVGGWQTFGALCGTVEELLAVVVYWPGGGQAQQAIPPAAFCLKHAQVFLHLMQLFVLIVILVVTSHI